MWKFFIYFLMFFFLSPELACWLRRSSNVEWELVVGCCVFFLQLFLLPLMLYNLFSAFVSFLPRAFVAFASSYFFLSAYNPWRNRFSNIRDEAAHTKRRSEIPKSIRPHRTNRVLRAQRYEREWAYFSVLFCFSRKYIILVFFSVSFSINHQTNKPGTKIYTQIYGSMGRLSHYARFWFRAM